MTIYDTEVQNIKDLKYIEQDRNDFSLYLSEWMRLYKKLHKIADAYNAYDISRILSNSHFSENDVKDILSKLDTGMWEQAVKSTGIHKLLTCQSVTYLQKQIAAKAPPFSEEYANAVIDDLIESTGSVINGTVREVLEKFTSLVFKKGNKWQGQREAQHHNCHKIEKSFRFSHFYGSYAYARSDSYDIFNDLEMVCLIVNEKPKYEYPNRIGDIMYATLMKNHNKLEFASEYFKVRCYLNGNVKIDFACDSTLNLINKFGADGTKLASASKIF